MGTFFEYYCNKCGFKEEYNLSGGFFTKEYYEESGRIERQLRYDIQIGKYGEMLKTLLESDTENNLVFSCNTELFQCFHCKRLLIRRDRKITRSDVHYDLNVQFPEVCPDCGKNLECIVNHQFVWCPACRKSLLELVSFERE